MKDYHFRKPKEENFKIINPKCPNIFTNIVLHLTNNQKLGSQNIKRLVLLPMKVINTIMLSKEQIFNHS